jgi:hypothetical protein
MLKLEPKLIQSNIDNVERLSFCDLLEIVALDLSESPILEDEKLFRILMLLPMVLKLIVDKTFAERTKLLIDKVERRKHHT